MDLGSIADWAIRLGVLGGVLAFWKVRFLDRPRLDIQVELGSAKSSAGTGANVNVTWYYKLILQNLTTYPATELEVVYRSSPLLDVRWPQHIERLDSLIIQNSLAQSVDRMLLAGTNLDYWRKDVLPEDFRNLKLVLCYRNWARLRFYSSFSMSGSKAGTKHSILKPRGLGKTSD